jgi:hypothetical protein
VSHAFKDVSARRCPAETVGFHPFAERVFVTFAVGVGGVGFGQTPVAPDLDRDARHHPVFPRTRAMGTESRPGIKPARDRFVFRFHKSSFSMLCRTALVTFLDGVNLDE